MRQLIYDTKSLLENIVSTWRLEARQESEDLFYYLDEISQLKNGDKCYVIGRKGAGKTAISEYFYNISEPSHFSERLSFKNFPFNYLYSLHNDNYTPPNQYITIWKYVIYNTICKLMSKNNSIDSDLLSILQKMYRADSIKALSKLLPQWTATEFGLEMLGAGFNIGGIGKEHEITSWIDKADILEDIIEKYAGNEAYYYVLIDELDEDYRDFEDEKQRKAYLNLLISLFKAVQDIKGYFKDTGIQIRPIVFLRSDIYSLIKDSDKNKWREFVMDISWKPDSLQKMLCHRLSVSSDSKIPEDDVWEAIIPQKFVFMGNRGNNRMQPFQYITRSTQWRPRDYIYYISQCAKLALEKNETVILSATIKQVDREFSEYLKGEVIDEIFAVLPDIDNVFSIISQVRKQTFQTKEFLVAYSNNTGKEQDEGKFVLRQLFEHGVIGNQPSMRGEQIFKYQYPQTLFNFNENVVIHRGLYKALQIF